MRLATLLALGILSGGCATLDAPVRRELVHVGDVAQAFDDAAYSGVADAAAKTRAALDQKATESAEVGLALRLKSLELAGALDASSAEVAAREFADALRALADQLARVDGALDAGAAKRAEALRIRKAADEVLKRAESFTWDDLADVLGGLSEEIPDGR